MAQDFHVYTISELMRTTMLGNEQFVTLETVKELKKPHWRPIDTAPKNGTKVLLYVPAKGWEGPHVGEWDSDKYAKYPKPFWNYTPHRISDSRGNPPSHWMPLPDAPPKEAPEA